MAVWLHKAVSEETPLRLYFKASRSSNRPQKDLGTYSPDPIPPPPGYENVSMEAPRNFGPDSMVDICRSQGVDIVETEEAQRQWKKEWALEDTAGRIKKAAPPAGNSMPPRAKPASPAAEPSSATKWWLVTTIMIALGALLWRLLNRQP